MKIAKVILNNFRSYQECEIDFQDFNCIVGKNDVGKSTILTALDWFFGNIELTDNDFNVDLVDADKYMKDLEDVALRGDCLCNGDELTVEVVFDCSNGFPDFFDNDANLNKNRNNYIDGNKNIHIRRYLLHSRSYQLINDEEGAVNKTGYHLVAQNSSSHSILLSDFVCKNLIHFKLDRANLSIYDYIKMLILNDGDVEIAKRITAYKNQIASEISNAVFANRNDENKKETITKENFSFSTELDILSNSQLLTKNGIPLRNRGDGFQMIVKNAIFRLLSNLEVLGRPTVFAFEEPEIHLHPEQQRQLYNSLKRLSRNHNYQIIFTTHSPFLVKELSLDKTNNIIVVKQEYSSGGTEIVKLNQLEERCINNYVSMNEINYIAFDEPSIEYHIELFGYIHNKLIYKYKHDRSFETYWRTIMTKPNRYGVPTEVPVSSIKGVDVWFEKCCVASKYKWFETDNYGEERRTLPYCVRNNIDHPLKTEDTSKTNGHKAFINNNKYFKQWIIKKSIELMRKVIKQHPDIFDD